MKSRRLSIALTFLLCCLALAPAGAAPADPASARPDPRTIRLKVGEFDPGSGLPGPVAGVARLERYPANERGGYLVQFDHPIQEADIAALERAGASVKGYVPMMALEVVMTEAVRAEVGRLPGVRWLGVYQPGFKIYPDLAATLAAPADPAEKILLQVSLFPGEEEPALTRIRGLGGRVEKIDRGRSFLLAHVEVARGRVTSLARIPQVRFVEEVYRPEENNDRSRDLTGLSDVADDTFSAGLDPSLDGRDEASGFQVKYGHFDGGLYLFHPDFSEPDVTLEPGANSGDLTSGHGTHTAGSIVGDGGEWATVTDPPPGSSGISARKWRGVTPQAALHHISFQNNYSDRQIFERESEEGAQISSNSWGYVDGTGNSIRNYNTNSAVWDAGVWDADDDVAGRQPLIVFFSAGNNGGFNSPYNGCTSSGGDNIGSPGTAKNVITVGNNETDRGAGGACGSLSALGDNVEEVNASSSRGPVDPDGNFRGLFKPDVTNIGGYWVMSTEAQGTGGGCGGDPDCPFDCSDTGSRYRYLNGTSMSTPLTAGMAGALLQDLVVHRGVAEPRPSLLKALLINGARDLQPTACDYTFNVNQFIIHEGWGFVQAKNSLYGPGGDPATRNIAFENEIAGNAVGTGESYTRQIVVSSGAPLKITLVWTDYPAAPSSGSPLVVNDLDLEVSGADGTFLGNNFSGNWSVTGGNPDRYNVVENVYIQNPIGGTYSITVRGFQVTQDQEPDVVGIDQSFSLVWSGNLAPQAVCGDATCSPGEDSCGCPGDCGPPAASETACADGADDDCDTLLDCQDPDCLGDPVCLGFCGDAACNAGEDCVSCPGDCISGGVECGNGICEAADGEDCETCAADCAGQTGGPPADRFCCGRDTPCSDGRCSANGLLCSETPTVPYCCGDGVCEGAETPDNCDPDCSIAAGAVPDAAGASTTPLLLALDAQDRLVLSWDPSCVATDDDFAIYEGTIGDWTSHVPRACSTGGATSVTLAPPAGSAYFLVVPHNGSREGSYGTDSAGNPRPPGLATCLPQQVGACP